MMTGHLKFILMKTLSEKKMSGYSLMKHISENTGCWKPSPGSVYPLLEDMLKAGILTMEQKDRKKIYTMTKKGRGEFEKLSTKRLEFIEKIMECTKVFGTIYEKSDMSPILDMLERMKKGEIPLHDLHPEVSELKMDILGIYHNDKLQRHKKEIKSILKKASAELRALA